MDRGFVILAQNNTENNYVLDACTLALSLHATQKITPRITLVTNNKVPVEFRALFENIVPPLYNDSAKRHVWKIQNRWKLYHSSPYSRTIVLDVDMLATKDLSNLWDNFENYNICWSTNPTDYRGNIIKSFKYRPSILKNNMPNIYSTVHFFKQSNEAKEYYTWLEIVMKNWEIFYKKFLPINTPTDLSVDISTAIVHKILTYDNTFTYKYPTFVHMKKDLQDWYKPALKWTDKVDLYLNPDLDFYIGNFKQDKLIHYAQSNAVPNRIVNIYRNKIGI